MESKDDITDMPRGGRGREGRTSHANNISSFPPN